MDLETLLIVLGVAYSSLILYYLFQPEIPEGQENTEEQSAERNLPLEEASLNTGTAEKSSKPTTKRPMFYTEHIQEQTLTPKSDIPPTKL